MKRTLRLGLRRAAVVSVFCGVVLAVGTLTQTSASGFTMPSFYSVPAHIPKAAGTVIKSEKVADSGVDGTTYLVMYVSKSVSNKPVPVTGLIFVPHASPPSGGYPVVSWGHSTDGMADV